MPIYEYMCETCNESFSLLLKMSAGTEEANCPKCGGIAKKLISACAIGSGGGDHSCVPSG